MQLQTGARVAQYEIKRLLGKGGMGEVYLARDVMLQRDVALKLLDPKFTADETWRARIRREARTIADLDHPNLCQVYAANETPDGQFYIAMKYYVGETLAQRMRGNTPSLEEALSIIIDVGQGLEAAHDKGVVHRDVKPANILLGTENEVTLVDFGIAKPFRQADDQSELTVEQTLIGTPKYMSPEQASAEKLDARSDLFSLGVVLYESVVGQPPFRGDSQQEVIRAIITMEPTPVSRIRPDLPARFEEIIRKVLAKTREDRYQTVKEFRKELESLRATLVKTVVPEHTPPPREPRRPEPRNPSETEVAQETTPTATPPPREPRPPEPRNPSETEVAQEKKPVVVPPLPPAPEPPPEPRRRWVYLAAAMFAVAVVVAVTAKIFWPGVDVTVVTDPHEAWILELDARTPKTVRLRGNAARTLTLAKPGYQNLTIELDPGRLQDGEELAFDLEPVCPAVEAPRRTLRIFADVLDPAQAETLRGESTFVSYVGATCEKEAVLRALDNQAWQLNDGNERLLAGPVPAEDEHRWKTLSRQLEVLFAQTILLEAVPPGDLDLALQVVPYAGEDSCNQANGSSSDPLLLDAAKPDRASICVRSSERGHLLVAGFDPAGVLRLVHPIDLRDDTLLPNVWTLVQHVVAQAPGGLVTMVAILSPEPWEPLLRSLGAPDRLGEADFFVLRTDEMIEGARSIAAFAASPGRSARATAEYRIRE